MKKLFTVLLLGSFIPLLTWAKSKDGFTIKGTVKGLNKGTAEIVYRNINGDDTTITSAINAEHFTLSGQLPEPELARFRIIGEWSYNISVFMENTEMSFSLIKDAEDKTEITGSASNIIYQRLEPQQLDFFENARKYDATRDQALFSHDPKAVIHADSVWAAQTLHWTSTIHNAIADQPGNYTALYFIQWLLFHPQNYDTIMSLFTSLDPIVRSGLSGKDFIVAFHHARQISSGQPAPEISGKDTSGDLQTLGSLKGHIVLLDFWASYCVRCRQENPQLKAIYEKYHPLGFEILSVSLDFEKSAWTKAIQADKMNWHHISDLRGGAAASAAIYDVQDIPRNYLIDQNGNIIAKDLSNTDLTGKLEEMINKAGK